MHYAESDIEFRGTGSGQLRAQVDLDEGDSAWDPDGEDIKGPAKVTYLRDETPSASPSGETKAYVSAVDGVIGDGTGSAHHLGGMSTASSGMPANPNGPDQGGADSGTTSDGLSADGTNVNPDASTTGEGPEVVAGNVDEDGQHG